MWHDEHRTLPVIGKVHVATTFANSPQGSGWIIEKRTTFHFASFFPAHVFTRCATALACGFGFIRKKRGHARRADSGKCWRKIKSFAAVLSIVGFVCQLPVPTWATATCIIATQIALIIVSPLKAQVVLLSTPSQCGHFVAKHRQALAAAG